MQGDANMLWDFCFGYIGEVQNQVQHPKNATGKVLLFPEWENRIHICP